MAIQSIESIKVGNFQRGEFAGGFIYGANFSLGGVDGPSTLTLSVVNEGATSPITPKYQGLRSGQIHKQGLSVRSGDEFQINVGSIELQMHLVGFSEDKSPELHTMTYEFIDTSHILDRIFVGLPNRHQKPQRKEGKYLITNLDAMCPNCMTGVINRKVNTSLIALRDAAFCIDSTNKDKLKPVTNIEYNFQYNPTNAEEIASKGGIITVGREEFIDHGSSAFKPIVTGEQKIKVGDSTVTYPVITNAELPCGVPNVTYKFVDLLAAIYVIGIEIVGLDGWEKGIKNDYRQSYTGTLREVLNNWCADFGYSFSWGVGSQKTIVFIDLNKGVESAFEEVKDLVENAQKAKNNVPDQPFLINNISYSTDMRGTYSSNYLSYYLKPHRPKSFSPFTYYHLRFHCLKVNEVFSPAACGMPGVSGLGKVWQAADLQDFLISCALAKYNPTARTLFNIQLKRWWAIGIHPTYEFTASEKDDIFQHLDSENLEAVLQKLQYDYLPGQYDPIKMNPINWLKAYIAYVDEEQASKWEEFERAIADEFLGQHYVLNPTNGASTSFDLREFEACAPVLNWKQEVQTTPSVKKIVNPSEVPWIKIASRSPAVQAGANAFVAKWLAAPEATEVMYVNVPASWGTLQERVDAVLEGDAERTGVGENAPEPASFNNLESGLGWYDNVMVDSGLFNKAGRAQEILIEQRRAAGEAERETGLGKLMGEANSAQVMTSYLYERSRYINPYRQRATDVENTGFYKGGQTPKFLVVSEDYISRSNLANGLNFYIDDIHQSINTFASPGSSRQVSASECTIRCESGLLETLCKCPTDADMEANFFVGLPASEKGLISESFSLSGPFGVVDIVLPVNSAPKSLGGQTYEYYGYAKVQANVRALLEGKKLVLDGDKENKLGYEDVNTKLSNLPENTLGIRVNAKDITNDADMVFQALLSSDNPIDAPSSLIKVVVPSENPSDLSSEYKGTETMMTLEEYHKRIKKYFDEESADSGKPSRSLSFSLLGNFYDVEYGDKKLSDYLKPEKGLTGFNVSFGSDGVTTNFTFETKRKELPKLEATMSKLGPTIWKSWYN